MISLENVSKKYDGKFVLNQINLQFSQGETHVILGSSGSGKSTLLRLLMGLIKPDTGEILIHSAKVAYPPTKGSAQKIGYVIQDGGLFPHMTAKENVILVAKTLKWDNDRLTSRFKDLCELVGFEPSLLLRHPLELSGGQRQRVGLMRALMLDPPVLLLDEPLGALDPVVRSSLQEELKRTFDAVKKTVVVVTHDIGEAAYFGHSITLLNEGRVIQKGSFSELVENPASPIVEEFIRAQRPPPQLKAIL